MMPKFVAVTQLDDEISASLRQRSERRREALTVLVGRLDRHKPSADLVDVLFALTSFEMFEALSVRNRTAKAVETLFLRWRNRR